MRIAIIGSNGYWGKNHVRILNQLGVDTVTCDVVGEANFNDYLDLRRIDGAVICTQPEYHHDIAFHFISSKIPVLIEKPMTMDMKEATSLCSLVKEQKHPTQVVVGHTYIYSPAIEYIKKYIQSGNLGKVYYASCDWKNLGLFQKSGVVWDLAPHPVSMMLYLLKGKEFKTFGLSDCHVIPDISDCAHIKLKLGDIDAYINLSWLDPMKTRYLTIVGDKKMIVFDDTEPMDKIKIYDKTCQYHDLSSDFGTWSMSYKYGDTLVPKIENKEPLKEEIEDFLWCIRDRKRVPKSNMQMGARVVQILQEAQK